MTSRPKVSHQPWEELAAGYALHALDQAEEIRLLDHVENCPRCRARLDEFTLVAAQLGSLGDTTVQPPAWTQIRPRIAGDRHAEATPPTTSEMRPLRQRRAARLFAAAAAAVIVAVGATTAWQLARSGGAPPTSAAVTACQHQDGCRVIPLHGQHGDTVAVLVAAGHASLAPVDLPAPPAGRNYVLWQMPRDGSPIPVVTMHDPDRQTPSAPLVASYPDTAAFAVSLEPTGPKPTHPTDVVALGAATS